MHKLAIVVPFYKPAFFKETLLSVLGQTDLRFNFYIADDASPSDIRSLLNQTELNISVKYERFTENIGGKNLVGHWHRAIELTKGESWIWLLCDDDVLSPNCVEEFYKAIGSESGNEDDVIRFATQVINENSQPITDVYKHPMVESNTELLIRRYENRTRSSLSEYIFSRKAFKKFGGFVNLPLAWGSDTLSWALFSSCGSIKSINHALVYFRSSGENISSLTSNLTQKLKANIKTIKWLKANEHIFNELPLDFYHRVYFSFEYSYFRSRRRLNMIDFVMIYYLKVLAIRKYNPLTLLFSFVSLRWN